MKLLFFALIFLCLSGVANGQGYGDGYEDGYEPAKPCIVQVAATGWGEFKTEKKAGQFCIQLAKDWGIDRSDDGWFQRTCFLNTRRDSYGKPTSYTASFWHYLGDYSSTKGGLAFVDFGNAFKPAYKGKNPKFDVRFAGACRFK